MTNLDLIAAIGAADSEDLERSERTACPRRRRITVRVLAAAAMLAVLSTTVFAVPAIRNALFGVTTRQCSISRIFVQEGKKADISESSIDVSLDVQMLPEAPDTLETCYAPMLPAERWEPIPLTVTEGTVVSFDRDTLLQWKNEDGDYVLFRQAACPDYTGGCGWDSVCTGFDAAYTVSQTELGGRTVQRIVVEPSEKETDGVRAEHPGLQKLYWSDGLYIFSMEVNYAMSDAELAEVLESVQPVADVSDLVVIERTPAPAPSTETLRVERILFPAALPEGYAQSLGARQPNGEYLFLWLLWKDDNVVGVLELSNGPRGRNSDIRRDWETFYIPDETERLEVNGTPVTCYQNHFRAQLLWKYEGVDYTLKASGNERLSVEELLEIMENLILTEDIDSVLTR